MEISIEKLVIQNNVNITDLLEFNSSALSSDRFHDLKEVYCLVCDGEVLMRADTYAEVESVHKDLRATHLYFNC